MVAQQLLLRFRGQYLDGGPGVKSLGVGCRGLFNVHEGSGFEADPRNASSVVTCPRSVL